MELTNELTVIISMFAMVISMFAILTGFIVAVWRGQATLIQRIDAETRNSFNLTNQNIEKIAEQVGSHAERVATVEGYISAVSDR